MKNDNTTIVICCAGMGTRLGIGTTKALVNICGKPLILYQLELLKNYDDVRIVLGYQAERVINIVKKYRKDIMFVFNYDYQTTGAAASLYKSIKGAREYTISIDGDLIIKPDDFKKFLNYPDECLAISNRSSDEPICVDVEDGKAKTFSTFGDYEWTGLAKVKTERIMSHKGHTYEMLESLLPLDVVKIDSRDIDTPDDYERVVAWVDSKYN